jgi:hypothetical protein
MEELVACPVDVSKEDGIVTNLGSMPVLYEEYVDIGI